MAKTRICSVCGKEHDEGYYLNGDYACSDECRNQYYIDHHGAKDAADAERMYLNDCEEDNTEFYWTQWWDE